MRSIVFALLLAGVILGGRTAHADSDDIKWVAQCLTENKDEKVSLDVVTKYCTCMNNKMSSNETQSITQWEKTHVAERTACDKEAGWRQTWTAPNNKRTERRVPLHVITGLDPVIWRGTVLV